MKCSDYIVILVVNVVCGSTALCLHDSHYFLPYKEKFLLKQSTLNMRHVADVIPEERFSVK